MIAEKLLLGALCTFRLAHLVHAEDGPFDVFAHLRRAAGEGFFGKLLDCFYCASLWVAAPLAFALGEGWGERLLLVPALSAGAIVVHRITARGEAAPIAWYEEDRHAPEVMLREGAVRRDDAPARAQAGS
jgi:hypothetical protein